MPSAIKMPTFMTRVLLVGLANHVVSEDRERLRGMPSH